MAASRTTILQIVPELDTGGSELSTVEIAIAIVKGGGRALVATTGGRLAERITAAGGEIIPFPAATKNPFAIWRNAARICDIARYEGVHLLHARSRAPAWSARFAAKRLGIPLVTTYHGAYSEKGPLKRAYNRVMADSDVVIANSRYTADLIRQRYGTANGRIRVIYRGIDGAALDIARIAPERIAATRARWGVAGDRRVILNAARLTHWKGQGTVVEAARRLAVEAAGDDWVVVLAGDAQGRDGYRDGLVAAIADAGLAERVLLVGHEADMPAALAASHVAVVASIEPEAFGRAAVEAQAIGCPVISTDIGAPPETVLAPPRVAAEARTGWLVAPGNAGALARALRDALSLSPAEREALALRSRTHVRAAFSLEQMQHATLGVYDGLLGSDLAQRFAA